ncbi:MAG: NAD(P)-dependent oxidoreductase [Ruminococcus sp.]|nr:NAD(P)-dependent oxidoreductase [Ruminococcus sp.]
MKLILTDRDLSFKNTDAELRRIKPSELKSFDGNCDVVAVAGTRALAIETQKLKLPNLKLFQLTSAGFDGVPLEAYKEKGVAVANAGNVYGAPIAETVVFGMLLMAKKLRKNPNNRHIKFTRGYSLITELSEKNVLIMGAGNIGTEVAKRLSGFDGAVDGYDPYCEDKPQYRKIFRNLNELKSVLDKYDYIISTLPHNEETAGVIDSSFFSKMKSSAVVINVGRKAVFNEKDFYNALKRKQISGAVLDMFELCPNPFTNPFRRLRNVVVLPGVAAISKEVKVRLDAHISKNLENLLSGNEINNVINK